MGEGSGGSRFAEIVVPQLVIFQVNRLTPGNSLYCIILMHIPLAQDIFVNVSRSGEARDNCGGEYTLFSAHPVHNGRPVWVKSPEQTYLLLFKAFDDLAGCWVIVRNDPGEPFKADCHESLTEFINQRSRYELTSCFLYYPRLDVLFPNQRMLVKTYPALCTAPENARKWFWHQHAGDPERDETCSFQWDSMPDSLPWGRLHTLPASDIYFAKQYEKSLGKPMRKTCQIHIGPSDCESRTVEVPSMVRLKLYPNPMRAFHDMSQQPIGICPAHEFRVSFARKERHVAGMTHTTEIYTAVTVTKIDGRGWTWDLGLTCEGDKITGLFYLRAKLIVTARVDALSRSVHMPAVLFGRHCRVANCHDASEGFQGRCRSLEQRIHAEILHESTTHSSGQLPFLCGDEAIELLLRLFDDDVLGLLQGLAHMEAGREVLAFGQAWGTIAFNESLRVCRQSPMTNGMMPCHDPLLLFVTTFDSPTATEFMTVTGLTVDDFVTQKFPCAVSIQVGLVAPGQLTIPDTFLPPKPAFSPRYEGSHPIWLKRMHGVVRLNRDGSAANIWNFDRDAGTPLTNLYSGTPWDNPLPMRPHGMQEYGFGADVNQSRRRFVLDKSGHLVSSHLRVGPGAPCRQLLHRMSDRVNAHVLVDPEGAIPQPGEKDEYDVFSDPLFVFGSPSFIRGNMACPACFYDDYLLWHADAISRVARSLPCCKSCKLGASFYNDLTNRSYSLRRGEHSLKTRINVAVERKNKRQKRGLNKRTWKSKKKSNAIILPTKEGDFGLVGNVICKVIGRDESLRHGEGYISNLFEVQMLDGTNRTMFVGYDKLRGISLLRRQALLKAAEVFASKVDALFNLFDADKDGALSSAEYRAYLVAIGLWGQGNYTEERWDKRWIAELEMLMAPGRGHGV